MTKREERKKQIFRTLVSSLWECTTTREVKVKSVPLGLLRIVLQMVCFLFVFLYQLWFSRGYQEFGMLQDQSVLIKIKGLSM